MTQPKFAPIESVDEVRPSYELVPAPAWTSHRPSEYRHGDRSHDRGLGTPGPDQGYALRLARLLVGELVLVDGEYEDDAMTAAVVIGLRRAAQFGRAPVLADLQVALHLFGFLEKAPPELVAYRRNVVAGISHDYRAQRELADSIPSATLAQRPEQIRVAVSNWPELTGHVLSTSGG